MAPKTLQELHALYEISPEEQIPLELYKAFLHSQQRITPPEKKTLKKGIKSTMALQKRIKWDKVVFHGKNESEMQPLSDKIDREITSGPLFENYIIGLITTNDYWKTSVCGTPESLSAELARLNIPREIFIKEIKKIYKSVQSFLPAILGYRSSWKCPYWYDEMVWNSYIRKWKKTGKKKMIAPKLRMYMLKVVRDKDHAATTIQAAWRRRQALIKIIRILLMKCLQKC